MRMHYLQAVWDFTPVQYFTLVKHIDEKKKNKAYRLILNFIY